MGEEESVSGFKVGDLVTTRLRFNSVDENWKGVILSFSISKLTKLPNASVLGTDGCVVEVSIDLLRAVDDRDKGG